VRALSTSPPHQLAPWPLRFVDRLDAGRLLAAELADYRGRDDVIVLGLPRGGAVVASEVAHGLAAPLDVLPVRRVLPPGLPEGSVGAIAGEECVLDDEALARIGLARPALERSISAARAELGRREELYRSGRPPPDLGDRTVILVDDGLVGGASMRAAIAAVRRGRPTAIVAAVPVGQADICERVRAHADDLVCVRSPEEFFSVELWYHDYSQVTDAEVLAVLEEAPRRRAPTSQRLERTVTIEVGDGQVGATLSLPAGATAAVAVAPGADSDRHSPRLRLIADALCRAGLGTILLDLLTSDEQAADRRSPTPRYRYDTALLARRMVTAVDWLGQEPRTSDMLLGCLGTSSSGPAALIAAAERPDRVLALATRGGVTQLTPPEALAAVLAPTLLIAGEHDRPIIASNRETLRSLAGEARLEIVEGASHAFWEPGKIERVAELARDWFTRHLG
jgi:putative phosphoribosyl transferase